MAYLFSQANKLSNDFGNVFGIGFKPFYDGLISIASKCLCIDILKFDEWLHQQHGNYEDDGKSMDDIIREHYGERGVALVNELMGDDLPDDPEPEKPKVKPKRAATKSQPTGKAKAKVVVKVASQPEAAGAQTSDELTLAERLRQALLKLKAA